MNDENIQTELQKYNTTDADLQAFKEKYGSLTIDGIKDKFGYAQVKEARKDVKSKRLWVDDKRKELKASSIERGRLIDAEAKRIKGHLEPIERHLIEQQKAVDDEKDRIKQKIEHAKKKMIQDRVIALTEVGAVPNIFHIQGMTDEQFEETLKKETERYNAELEEKRKQEAARLEIQAENERARIAADKLRLEKEAEEKRLFEEGKERLRIAQEQIYEKNAELKEREDEVERSRLFIEAKLEEERKRELEKNKVAEKLEVTYETAHVVPAVLAQEGEFVAASASKECVVKKHKEVLELAGTMDQFCLFEDILRATAKKYFEICSNDEAELVQKFRKQIKEQLDGN